MFSPSIESPWWLALYCAAGHARLEHSRTLAVIHYRLEHSGEFREAWCFSTKTNVSFFFYTTSGLYVMYRYDDDDHNTHNDKYDYYYYY